MDSSLLICWLLKKWQMRPSECSFWCYSRSKGQCLGMVARLPCGCCCFALSWDETERLDFVPLCSSETVFAALRVPAQINEYLLANIQRDLRHDSLLNHTQLSIFSPWHCSFIFSSNRWSWWLHRVMAVGNALPNRTTIAGGGSLRLVSPTEIWRSCLVGSLSFQSHHSGRMGHRKCGWAKS